MFVCEAVMPVGHQVLQFPRKRTHHLANAKAIFLQKCLSFDADHLLVRTGPQTMIEIRFVQWLLDNTDMENYTVWRKSAVGNAKAVHPGACSRRRAGKAARQ